MLPQYVFPGERMFGMKQAIAFLNNDFAPDYLRHMFVESTLTKYAPILSAQKVDVCSKSARDRSVSLKNVSANVPRIFDLFEERPSPILEYHGEFYSLANIKQTNKTHLYSLVTLRADHSVKSYTYPFQCNTVEGALLVGIGVSPNGVHVGTDEERTYEISFSQIRALTV
jgi:hypothetical protein